jgi:fluoride exporter
MSLTNVLLVGAGGFLGTIARYLCSVIIGQKFDSDFPYGTFAVNILGY